MNEILNLGSSIPAHFQLSQYIFNDPIFPSIHELYHIFNHQFFNNKLGPEFIHISWSKKMTSCAGLCYYLKPTKNSPRQFKNNQLLFNEKKISQTIGFCKIKLSECLLKYRPTEDLINTLLHEMIHAYLFLYDPGSSRDHSGHGPKFIEWMNNINHLAGTKITIYHNFHDEVNYYKVHIWQCQVRYPWKDS